MYYFIKLHCAPELRFNEAHKVIVHRSIEEVAEQWSYELHALAVNDDGVHLLVSQGDKDIKFITTGMKAWSTRNLRENRTIGTKQPVWEKGSEITLVEDKAEYERIRSVIEAD
jgi:REP element-mobilizing transposase RayT